VTALEVRPPQPAGESLEAAAPGAPRRRTAGWKAAIPIYVVLLLIVVSVALHLVAEPDLGDPGTLSPYGTGPDGSSQLAAALQAGGAQLTTVTSTKDLASQDWHSDTVLFVPAPGFLDPGFLSDVDRIGVAARVVLVEPDYRTLVLWDLPVYGGSRRWATGVLPPDCDTGAGGDTRAISAAGPAAVNRTRYQVADTLRTFSCYGGGVVGARLGSLDVDVVGASDPFRNAHFNEVGNAALATALLGGSSNVLWMDVHADEPLPKVTIGQPQDTAAPKPWHREDLNRTQADDPTWRAFPAPLWAALATALVVGFLLALASARRLGGPVPEPLPVVVPASETVRGRGRLYARIGARDSTLTALRMAAIVRIARLVDPLGGAAAERELTGPFATVPAPRVRGIAPDPPSPAIQAFIDRVAERTGTDPAWVFATLYGPPPKDDEALAAAVDDLDRLSYAMTRDERRTVHKGDTP
jgi:hypothetical protein